MIKQIITSKGLNFIIDQVLKVFLDGTNSISEKLDRIENNQEKLLTIPLKSALSLYKSGYYKDAFVEIKRAEAADKNSPIMLLISALIEYKLNNKQNSINNILQSFDENPYLFYDLFDSKPIRSSNKYQWSIFFDENKDAWNTNKEKLGTYLYFSIQKNNPLMPKHLSYGLINSASLYGEVLILIWGTQSKENYISAINCATGQILWTTDFLSLGKLLFSTNKYCITKWGNRINFIDIKTSKVVKNVGLEYFESTYFPNYKDITKKLQNFSIIRDRDDSKLKDNDFYIFDILNKSYSIYIKNKKNNDILGTTYDIISKTI